MSVSFVGASDASTAFLSCEIVASKIYDVGFGRSNFLFENVNPLRIV